MDERKIKKYIENLARQPKNFGILEFFFLVLSHFFAKWILILKGKDEVTFDELLKALGHENQEIVAYVVDILGRIGNKKAIPFLKDLLKRDNLWGLVVCSAGGSLIRLGDGTGVDYLKELIANSKVHRHTRLDAANLLLRLKIKDVFEKDERIDFGGETMTPEWSEKLEKLVNKLRKRS